MAIGGEWLCMRWELEPILLGGAMSAQERKRTGEQKRKASAVYQRLDHEEIEMEDVS